jgi:flagellar biosynthesis anti-sigma factor FlgM
MVDPVSAGRAAVRPLPPAPAKEGVTLPNPANVNVDNIKSLPRLVNLASQLAEQGPPYDFVKIAAVRQAIALGTYRVSPDAVADGMLRFAGKAAAA